MNVLSGRKEPAPAGSFRLISPRTRLAIAVGGLAVLIAAAAAAQRPDEQPRPAVRVDAPVPMALEIPRLRQQGPWRPAAALSTPPRNPFAFDMTEGRPSATPSAALDRRRPVEVAPPPPLLPQLIGIVSDAAADGPRYRAVLVTAQGDLWFAAEGDSRDGFTVRHLTEQSADLVAGESAPAAHLALP